jgi:hypothetical protein
MLVIAAAIVALGGLFLAVNAQDDDVAVPDFVEKVPATAPVVVAQGTTASGGSWRVEAYFTDQHEVCTRFNIEAPITAEPDAPRAGKTSGGNCSEDRPLALSGSSDRNSRVFHGSVALDASAVRLVKCNGATRNVPLNRSTEFGRAFFGIEVPNGTVRRIVVNGADGTRVAEEDLPELRLVTDGDKRHSESVPACSR